MSDGESALVDFIKIREYINQFSDEEARNTKFKIFHNLTMKNLNSVKSGIVHGKGTFSDKQDRLELTNELSGELESVSAINYEDFILFSMRLAFISTPEIQRKEFYRFVKIAYELENDKAWLSHAELKMSLEKNTLTNSFYFNFKDIVDLFPNHILIPTTQELGVCDFNNLIKYRIYPVGQNTDPRGLFFDGIYGTNVVFFFHDITHFARIIKAIEIAKISFNEFDSIVSKISKKIDTLEVEDDRIKAALTWFTVYHETDCGLSDIVRQKEIRIRNYMTRHYYIRPLGLGHQVSHMINLANESEKEELIKSGEDIFNKILKEIAEESP